MWGIAPNPRTTPGRAPGLAVLAIASALLTGCTSGADTGGPSPTERLAAAKAKADAATSIHLTLTSRDVPEGASGIVGADGVGTHAPAFEGTLNARLNRVQADIGVVAVDGALYLKMPFTSSYGKTDPATYAAPDPATLFAPDKGITSLLTVTTGAEAGDDVRDGSEVLATITGKLPGRSVADLLRVGSADDGYDVTYALTTNGGELRKASLTGPFFADGRSTYEVRLDRYGEPVDITRP